jgi:hypothetical protein
VQRHTSNTFRTDELLVIGSDKTVAFAEIHQMHPVGTTQADSIGDVLLGIVIGFILGIIVLVIIELLVYIVLTMRRQSKETSIGDTTKETITSSEVGESVIKNNLDRVQASILQAIHNGDVLLQSDIPEMFKLTKTRVSEILNEFERSNLIKRERAGRTYRLYSNVIEAQ